MIKLPLDNLHKLQQLEKWTIKASLFLLEQSDHINNYGEFILNMEFIFSFSLQKIA